MMREQDVWEKIQSLEQAMRTMHESLDSIITGCNHPDAFIIRNHAHILKTQLTQSFERKFHLIEAIRGYFQ